MLSLPGLIEDQTEVKADQHAEKMLTKELIENFIILDSGQRPG